MSEKAGSISKLISVPKVGGAFKDFGEKFSPDLHIETANISVPIALPPGRNSFQPQLILGFCTGSDNGPFGFGWGFNIPGVSRRSNN